MYGAAAAFKRAFKAARPGSSERALTASQYGQTLQYVANASRAHVARLDGVAWQMWLGEAEEVLRTESAAAPASAAGALAFSLARVLDDLGEADPGEPWDAPTLLEALELARRAREDQLFPPLDRVRACVLETELAGKLMDRSPTYDPERVNGDFAETATAAADLSPGLASGVAGSWGKWALRAGRPHDAQRAFAAALLAGEQVLHEQVSWRDQEAWLGLSESLTGDAALALILTDERERAVEVLERGRRGVLTEGLGEPNAQRRELTLDHPALIAELDRARAELRAVVLPGADRPDGFTAAGAADRASIRAARARLQAAEAAIESGCRAGKASCRSTRSPPPSSSNRLST
jgi:hypothetical protein